MKTNSDLNVFNATCDELALGKYLLADIKIASILNICESVGKLKNIISSCCDSYNFSQSFSNSISMVNGENKFTLPSSDNELIALIYNLLSAFKNNSIKLSDFLSKFYVDNNGNNSFGLFANNVILPFKNAINSKYAQMHVLVEENEFQNNLFNKVKTTVKLIISNIDNYKLKMAEKEEFTMLLNAIYNASEKNDKKLVYSLMIGVDYFSKYNKKTRNAYLSLEECFV